MSIVNFDPITENICWEVQQCKYNSNNCMSELFINKSTNRNKNIDNITIYNSDIGRFLMAVQGHRDAFSAFSRKYDSVLGQMEEWG